MSIIQFKEAKCKNCYKCVRNCPVKAIAFNNEQARIINDDCILCGKCLQICPQNAKSVKNDIDLVKSFIDNNEQVYASIAPSYAAAFNTAEPGKVDAVLKKLGFRGVEETARGAVQVSRQYEKLIDANNMNNIITTACPTVVSLVEKYYPELIDQLAAVVSPMVAHAKMLRYDYGKDIKVVFIGPCISKKDECNDIRNEGLVDAVITFEELEQWMLQENISFETAGSFKSGVVESAAARYYPEPGGILKTIDASKKKKYKCIGIDGIDGCIEALGNIKNGGLKGYFIEMNSCTGGCLGGPCIRKLKGGTLEGRNRLSEHIEKYENCLAPNKTDYSSLNFSKVMINRSKDYVIPSESVIREILVKTGKATEEQELNCGTCGYPTCRDKAIAVYNNKAELHMCLPYMRERAESISNIIIHSTPNAIIALNKELHIQEINKAAGDMLKVEEADARGKHIFELLDCYDFETVLETGINILDKKYFYEKYRITVEQSILYIQEQQVIIAIMKDITKEEKNLEQIYKMRYETVDVAQKVIEKQMRVAQEIASLLGETTAETKLALTRLKKSISDETPGDKKRS